MPKYYIWTEEKITLYRAYEFDSGDVELTEGDASWLVGVYNVGGRPNKALKLVVDEDLPWGDRRDVKIPDDCIADVAKICPYCFIEWRIHGLQPINCYHRKEEFE